MITKISPIAWLVLVCILLACDTAVHMAQAKSQAALSSVNAHQFTVVSDTGKPTVKIYNVQGKYPRIEIYDDKGNTRILAAVQPNSQPQLSLYDTQHEAWFSLEQSAGGSHMLIAQPGKRSIFLSARQDGSADIRLLDPDGKARIALGCATDGTPSVVVSDRNGVRKATMTISGVKTQR